MCNSTKSFCEGNVFEESLQSIIDTKFDIFKTLPTPVKCLTCKYYKQYCNGGCKYKEYNMINKEVWYELYYN